MTYTRGSDEEYDRWANLTGDSGWEWKNLAPYYFKVHNKPWILGTDRKVMIYNRAPASYLLQIITTQLVKSTHPPMGTVLSK